MTEKELLEHHLNELSNQLYIERTKMDSIRYKMDLLEREIQNTESKLWRKTS